MVETGERICEVQCNAPTFTVAWHPQKPLLAFACDDKVNTKAMCKREVVIFMSLVLFWFGFALEQFSNLLLNM